MRLKLIKSISLITLASLGFIFSSTLPAQAATTALDTGLDWFDNYNLTYGQYFAFTASVDAPFTVESVGILIGTGRSSDDVIGSTITFYTGHPNSPTNDSDLLGTLSFNSIESEAGVLRVTYSGSVSIPTAGEYWWKLSNLPTGKDVWVILGGYSGHTGTWSAWGGTANWDYNGSVLDNVGEYPRVLITGTPGVSGGSSSPTQEEINAQNEAKKREELRKLEEQQRIARLAIVNKVSEKIELKNSDLTAAGLPTLSEAILAAVNIEVTKIASQDKIDFTHLNLIFAKYQLYNSLTKEFPSSVSARDLVKFGVIAESTPMKTLATHQLLKLPLSDRDTIEKVDAFFKRSTSIIEQRKNHLLAIFAKIQSR